MAPKISNEVLVERIDNMAKDVKEIKDLYLDMASNIKNLQTAFVPRDELSRIESNWKTPLEKLTNTVYGPDGTAGLVVGNEKNKNGITTIWTVIGIYITVASAIFGFIIWQLFTRHV